MAAEEDLKSLLRQGIPEDDDSVSVEEDASTDVLHIGVLGAGTMGQGISEVASQAGIDVILIEKDDRSLQESLLGIEDHLDYEISRWSKTESDKKAILSRIHGTVDPTEAQNEPIVIEALPDNLELKKEIFASLDKICHEDTILITNTSTLSITEIAAVTGREDQVIGMHFLYPVSKTPVVEVVRGLKTSDDTFRRTFGFAQQLKKTPVEVFEYPGYVTTRIILPMLNEAMHVLMEGTASAGDIDTAIKLGYNMDHGPLALADQMGLDEVMIWMESLFHELGDLKYRPCPLLRKLVRAGHLGKKTHWGFFRYDKNGHIIPEEDAQ
ncbi:3-hydroxybutyryl-CoA dehydrogenase [candidate division LCP-89 bacterium B3_LCP]|uniref:3-hydroxybutyryl-CoA dehydrogenase n=1 Tax=candidate division LCP-89 bacterium B3_LCP TaxID=2012998 RepID=A0A532V6A0_UNCL8|nr:MAG: 3-hydroxybutyryl-CoA dehydrogenase [candidate division LCP-89 bacterium B3_LCP]